jgi:hypothetical protein
MSKFEDIQRGVMTYIAKDAEEDDPQEENYEVPGEDKRDLHSEWNHVEQGSESTERC